MLTTFFISTLRRKTRWNASDSEIVSIEFWETLKVKSNTDDCGNEITELNDFWDENKNTISKKSHSKGSTQNKDIRMP